MSSIRVLMEQQVRYEADSRKTAQAAMGVETGRPVAAGGELVVVGGRRDCHGETPEFRERG